MGAYALCPSCTNINTGDTVYRCKVCNTVFCDACKNPSKIFGKDENCPVCETEVGVFRKQWAKMGRIG